MAQRAGRADIYVNGQLIDTFDGVTLDTGGMSRQDASTNRTTGFTKKRVLSKLELERAFGRGASIADLDVENAVVQVKWDTGQVHIIRNAYRADPESVADTGKGKVTLMGDPAEEVL